MSALASITTGRQHVPRRILVYGVQGVGKSTYASQAPHPVFIPTEDGVSNIDCARFPLARSMEEVLDALGALYAEPHNYQTVVIDSLDWLERLIWTRVIEERGSQSRTPVTNIEDFGYARGYTYALDPWREILEGLAALRDARGMTIILLAHAKIERFENPETEAYDRYSPRLHKHAAALVQEWCDEVLFATYRVHTKQSDEGFDRTRTRGIGTGDRILRTTERPAHLAKNRLSLPDELPLDFAAFAQYLPA